jgi:hypothetical protein
MRTAWLVPLLVLSLPPACSDDEGGDDNAGGSAGTAGGAAGRAAAGASGAGRSGAAGTAGRGAAGGAGGSAGSSGAAGAAGSSGAAGAAGSSASQATGCEGLCARSPICPGDSRAECLSSCENAVELCPDESEALLECGESLSDSDFQCVGGVAIPNDDLCIPESTAFARCRIGF